MAECAIKTEKQLLLKASAVGVHRIVFFYSQLDTGFTELKKIRLDYPAGYQYFG